MREDKPYADLEREVLIWKERQLRLRQKYPDTPPGIGSEEAVRLSAELEARWNEYREAQTCRLLSSYVPAREPFAGRKRYLEEIARRFAAGGGPVVLYGIGGIGKTAIARAYIREHEDAYDRILFLSFGADFLSLFCSDVQVPVSNLNYSTNKYENKNHYFREKLAALAQIAGRSRLLLVIDDCNTGGDRKMGEVFALPCHILITSRVNPAVWGGCSGIEVRPFETDEEWEEFVRLYGRGELTPGQQRELEEYRRRVGGHTLLMMLKIHGAKLDGLTPDGFAGNLFERFSLKRDEKQALRELSVLPVQGIEEGIYRQISAVKRASLNRLEDCLLLRRERQESGGSRLALHPLIAEAARTVFAPAFSNCRGLVRGLSAAVGNAWNRSYLENQRLEPYVLAILERFGPPPPGMEDEYGGFMTLLWVQGYFEEAETYALRWAEAAEAHYGPAHQKTGEVFQRIAAVYYNSMNFEKANVWYRKSYESLRAGSPVDGRYYHWRARAASKLSRMYRYEGKPELALEYIGQAISDEMIFREQYEAYSPKKDGKCSWCHWQLNKARIFYDQGRFDEAWELGRSARDGVAEEIRAGKHFEYDLNEFDRFLVKSLMQQKEYGRAEKLARAVLDKTIRYRSEKSKEAISSREQLADVCAAAGRQEEALSLYRLILQWLCEDFPRRTEWIGRVEEKLAQLGGAKQKGDFL